MVEIWKRQVLQDTVAERAQVMNVAGRYPKHLASKISLDVQPMPICVPTQHYACKPRSRSVNKQAAERVWMADQLCLARIAARQGATCKVVLNELCKSQGQNSQGCDAACAGSTYPHVQLPRI